MILHSLLVLLNTLSPSVFATSFYIRPFSEFTATTPHIVRGVLNNIHTENSITSDGAKTIYTYATLDVKEELKGNIGKPEITIRKIGGTKDGYTLEIPSSPEFKNGEETVVFLSEMKEDSTFEVTGLELGKFGLEEKNGDSVLTGGIFNYSKPNPAGAEAEHAAHAEDLSENQHPWTVTQLKNLVREQNLKSPAAQTEISKKPISSNTPATNTQTGQTLTNPQVADSQDVSNLDQSTRNYLPYFITGVVLLLGLFLFLRRR